MDANIRLIGVDRRPHTLVILDNCVFVDEYITILLFEMKVTYKIVDATANLTEIECKKLVGLFIKHSA